MPGAREVIERHPRVLGIEFMLADGASLNTVLRVQNTRLAVAPSSLTISLMIPWAALDMAHKAGGFKVNCRKWFRLDENSTWDEALGLVLPQVPRCSGTGEPCRKIRQNARFAYYLDRLPPKHTIFPPII
jgi:hypothetical protein